MRSNTFEKKYSQPIPKTLGKTKKEVIEMETGKDQNKHFMLLPHNIVVDRPKKVNEEYIYNHRKENSMSKERINVSSYKEEREVNSGYDSSDRFNTARRLIGDPTLQKIRMFMEQESKSRRRRGENEEIPRNKTLSFFKIIPSLNLDLSSREYPTFNTECNTSIREKGGIIPMKGISQKETGEIREKYSHFGKEIKKTGFETRKEIIEKEGVRENQTRNNVFQGNKSKEVRQRNYDDNNNDDDFKVNAFVHKETNIKERDYIKIKDNYNNDVEEEDEEQHQPVANDNEKNFNYSPEHISDKQDDDDNQFEIQVNTIADNKNKGNTTKTQTKIIDKEENNSDIDNKHYENYNFNQNLPVYENEEANFAEIKKLMNENEEENGIEIEMPEDQSDHYNNQKENEGDIEVEIENNDENMNQQKPTRIQETIFQKNENKNKINDIENNEQAKQPEQEPEKEDEDIVKIQRTEENQYTNNNITNIQYLPVIADIIGQNKPNKKQQYQKDSLIRQSSIQFEQHPPHQRQCLTEQNDEYIYQSPYDYDYNSRLINHPQQSHEIIAQSNQLYNVPYSSKIESKPNYICYHTQSDNEYLTEQSNNPSNLYSTIKTDTSKSRYQHHQDYFPTDVLITESPNRMKCDCFLEKTAQVLNNPNSRSNTVERESKYEQLKNKYQYDIQKDNRVFSKERANYDTNNNAKYSHRDIYNNYRPIQHKSVNISQTQSPSQSPSYSPISLASFNRKERSNVKIQKRNEEESDKDKFNLNFNYSNENLYDQICQKHQCFVSNKAQPAMSTEIKKGFIQDKELPQQIFTNNYKYNDLFIQRSLLHSLNKDDSHTGNQREIKQYFDSNLNPSNTSRINQFETIYQLERSINEEYNRPLNNEITVTTNKQCNCRCNCKSSREEFSSLYLKAFPTFSFTRYSSTQSQAQNKNKTQMPTHNYKKLCFKCKKEIAEQSIMNTLL